MQQQDDTFYGRQIRTMFMIWVTFLFEINVYKHEKTKKIKEKAQ